MTSEVIVPRRKLKSGVTVSPEEGCGVNDVVHRPAPACCRCRSCAADLGDHSPTAASPVEVTEVRTTMMRQRQHHGTKHMPRRRGSAIPCVVSRRRCVRLCGMMYLSPRWLLCNVYSPFVTDTSSPVNWPLTQILMRVFSTFMASWHGASLSTLEPSKRPLKP